MTMTTDEAITGTEVRKRRSLDDGGSPGLVGVRVGAAQQPVHSLSPSVCSSWPPEQRRGAQQGAPAPQRSGAHLGSAHLPAAAVWSSAWPLAAVEISFLSFTRYNQEQKHSVHVPTATCLFTSPTLLKSLNNTLLP